MERTSKRENSFCSRENIKSKFKEYRMSIYKYSQFIGWEFAISFEN